MRPLTSHLHNTSTSASARNMSPTPSSPVAKLSSTHRTSSQDSTSDGIRKRVCKACDRCRLKKSKCDGSSPCLRCKADNAICVFGERKKSHDKVYPKGYVEMLEQQQAQLVSGLQEMYRRLRSSQVWDGDALPESNGQPLTHDILAALKLLETKHDGTGSAEMFEEDVTKIQARLLAEGHGFAQRRGSLSSDSEHSQHGASGSATTSTPTLTRPVMFRDSFAFESNSASPLVQSPMPQQQPQQQQPSHATVFRADPSLYAPEWAQALSDAVLSQSRPQFSAAQTQSPQSLDDLDLASGQWTSNLNFDGMFVNGMPQFPDLQAFQDVPIMDNMDVDFSKFVNPGAAMEVYN